MNNAKLYWIFAIIAMGWLAILYYPTDARVRERILRDYSQEIQTLSWNLTNDRSTREKLYQEWKKSDDTLSGSIITSKSRIEKLQLCLSAKSIDCEEGKKEAMISLIPRAYAESITWTASGAIVPPTEQPSIDELSKLQEKVCGTVPTSPICTGKVEIRRIEKIANDTGVPIRFLIGISYAESHIGTNFAPQKCSYTNNWAWLKAYKYSVNEWAKWTKMPNSQWCWLYEFDDTYQFFQSLANTIKSYSNANCSTPECVSKNFVWGDGTKRDWSYRVRLFYNP